MRRLIDITATAAVLFGLIFILGWMQGRDDADRRAAYAEFIRTACVPRHIGERAIARLDDRQRLHCVITENNGWGLVPGTITNATYEGLTP